jgi:hypothetical protein
VGFTAGVCVGLFIAIVVLIYYAEPVGFRVPVDKKTS